MDSTLLLIIFATVVIILLPTGFLLGRIGRKPVLVTNASAETTADAKPAQKAGPPMKINWMGALVAVALIAVAAMVITNWDWASSRISLPQWSLSLGLGLGALLILCGLLGPKEAKGFLFILGILTIVLSLAFSGPGQRVASVIDWADNCAATSDCGPRLEDLPVYGHGALVEIRSGQPYTFYSDGGTVQLRNNNPGHCLNIGPEGDFHIQSSAGGRLVSITPYSGQKKLAVVQLRPARLCG